jgi:hypothetical protein
MKRTNAIVVGPRDVELTLPSHVRGVHEGNWPAGEEPEEMEEGRSTGINAKARAPIDPRSPKLTPP